MAKSLKKYPEGPERVRAANKRLEQREWGIGALAAWDWLHPGVPVPSAEDRAANKKSRHEED